MTGASASPAKQRDDLRDHGWRRLRREPQPHRLHSTSIHVAPSSRRRAEGAVEVITRTGSNEGATASSPPPPPPRSPPPRPPAAAPKARSRLSHAPAATKAPPPLPVAADRSTT